MATKFHAKGNNSQVTGLASFSISCAIDAGDAVVIAGSWDSASTTTPTVATTGGAGSDSFTLVYGPFTVGIFKYGAWLLQSAGTGRTGATVSWASSNPAFADGGCWSFSGQASSVLDRSARSNGSTAGSVSSGNTSALTSADEFSIGYGASSSSLEASGGGWQSDGQIVNTSSWLQHQLWGSTSAIHSQFLSPLALAWITFVLTFMATPATQSYPTFAVSQDDGRTSNQMVGY